MAAPLPVEDAGVYRGVQIWWLPYMNTYRFTYGGAVYREPTLARVRRTIDRLAERLLAELPPEEIPEELIAPPVVEVPEEVPEKPEVEEVEVPTFVTPKLPWYAAWLKPVITFIGMLTEAVANFFAPIFAPISDAAVSLGNLPESIVSFAVNRIRQAALKGRDAGIDIAIETIDQATGESPEWVIDLRKKLEDIFKTIVGQYQKALNIETYEESPITHEDAPKKLEQLGALVNVGSMVNWILHVITESGSMGQIEAIADIDTMVITKLGVHEIARQVTMLPLEKGLLKIAEQQHNFLRPNEIPTYTDLIQMVTREVIDLDDFKLWMRRQGFNEAWSQAIWDAHFIPPNLGQLLQAFYRGEITREELENLKILVDLDPRYKTIWDAQIEQIPPYSELVNQLVKEVIDRPTFLKYMKYYGFDEAWADRIWDAHFIPPSLGDGLTAWRRGLISEEELDDLMILIDLDPRFKEVFDTRKYVDPGLRTARYMFEVGAIDEDRLKELVKRAGYLPEDVEGIVDLTVRFQERLFRRRYLIALQTGVIRGAYTPEELTAEVVAAGYTKEVAEWMIKTAEVRTKIAEVRRPTAKAKVLTMGDLKKAYARGFITEDEFRTELLTRGFPIGDVDLLIELLDSERVTEEAGGRKIALSQAELLNAFRYGQITEDHLRTELQLRGLSLDEVNILIETKKRQWGLVVE